MLTGLGNPGPAHVGTRHNVGAEVVTRLAERQGVHLRRGPRRVGCLLAKVTIEETAAMLVLPLAFMNVCGPVIRAALDYHKAAPSDLLVIHDDIDLPFGRLRLHEARGHGGHNGVRSVIGVLGTPGFWRLKVGLGRPPGRMDPAAFVLGRFSKAERPEIDLLVMDAADVVEVFMTDPDRAIALAAGRRLGDH